MVAAIVAGIVTISLAVIRGVSANRSTQMTLNSLAQLVNVRNSLADNACSGFSDAEKEARDAPSVFTVPESHPNVLSRVDGSLEVVAARLEHEMIRLFLYRRSFGRQFLSLVMLLLCSSTVSVGVLLVGHANSTPSGILLLLLGIVFGLLGLAAGVISGGLWDGALERRRLAFVPPNRDFPLLFAALVARRDVGGRAAHVADIPDMGKLLDPDELPRQTEKSRWRKFVDTMNR